MNKVIKVWIFLIPMGILLILTTSCKKNEGNSTVTTIYTIGQTYGGGRIFYIDGTGQHGLIAATSDQSIGIAWSNGPPGIYFEVGTAIAIGTGQVNTTAIVAAQGPGNYAAKVCDELVLNGYSDWFLPSKDELNQMCEQKIAIGGFSESDYWSSSEESSARAYCQYFNQGGGR